MKPGAYIFSLGASKQVIVAKQTPHPIFPSPSSTAIHFAAIKTPFPPNLPFLPYNIIIQVTKLANIFDQHFQIPLISS